MLDVPLPIFLTSPKAKNVYLNPRASYLVLDFETTGKPLDEHAELVLACWTKVTPSGKSNHFLWGDEFSMQELLDDISSVDFIVAHNAKFELQWLRRCGLDLRSVLVWCTFLAEWVLDGNLSTSRKLGDVARRRGCTAKLDLVGKLWKAGVGTKDIPRSWLLEYCQGDVKTTHELFLVQRMLVYENNQQHLVYQRCLTCACLADIEFNGMYLDGERVLGEHRRVVAEIEECETKLLEISGGINLNSPKQLGEFLYQELGFDVPKDRRGRPLATATGGLPTAAPIISQLRPTTPRQREFLEYYGKFNKLKALLTKNLEFFKGTVEHNNSTFRAVFNQGITQTHRLSSSGIPTVFPGNKKAKSVQFQNLPRQYKKLFWSGDEDYFVGEADGSQLEFRVAADLGRDPVAYEVVATKGDVHTDTAKVFVDWNRDNPNDPHPDFIGKDYKSGRQAAKPRTFAPLYGGTGSHPAEQGYAAFFRNKYEQIYKTQRGWALTVVNDKSLRTPYGMRFFWPDTKMDRSGYITNTTSIFNYPIQGLATAEIIPIALVHFWHATKGTRILILNTIHDSIVARVHKDDVELYKKLSVSCFTSVVYKFLKDVYEYEFVTPLGCGIKISRNWGEADKEMSFDVFPDGKVNIQEK